MCIKTLNPKAPEWRPIPKHRQPPLPPPHNNISLSRRTHEPDFIPAYAQSWPLRIPYSLSVYEISSGDKPASGAGMGFSAKKKAVGRKVANGPKCPSVFRTSKPLFMREHLPPRLRRVEQRFRTENPPTHPRVWRPNKPVKPADGRAYRLSPAQVISGSGNNTTVMIKNIPNSLRRDFMLKFLDDNSGKNGLEYDFLYLPMDFRSGDNLGYAFVNFTTSAAALKFKSLLKNFAWGRPFMSNKVCDVTWARIQGRAALVERFKNTYFECNRLDFLPVILDPPRDGSNPNPTPVILGYLNPNAWKKRN